MPEFTGVGIIVLLAFGAWCVGVFFFLRRMAARGKKSAAEHDPAREGMDEIIDRIEKRYPPSDPDGPSSFRHRR